MKAAVVTEQGQPPIFADFAEPVAPAGMARLRVRASAISQITRSRASGNHYSSGTGLPLVPGIDGVGVDATGRRVYFLMPEAPYGGMAEWTLVDPARLIELPPALDEVQAAAMAIPGMSSWAALVERAGLRRGETVLVNGATGTSGQLAVQVARHLGASKVIATGRHPPALAATAADETIALGLPADALAQRFAEVFAQGVDVVLDYLWGESALALIAAAARHGPERRAIRFVQIGSISGADISLPSAALRSSALQLMGSGIGSVPFARLLKAVEGVLQAAPTAGFRVDARAEPLAQVGALWSQQDGRQRIVLCP